MKISLNWLRDFVAIPSEISPKELGQIFTLRTAEVEHVEEQAQQFDHIVVGQIEKIEKHPNADKLRVTQTNVGNETLQIVCGASNISEGMFVAVALVGAKVRWHGEGDLITLEKAKLRGVESYGMICAGEEIGLEATPEGILDLSTLVQTEELSKQIGKSLGQVLGYDDVILTVDNKSLTHRPDLWGHYGIAREMAAIFNTSLQSPEVKVDYPNGSNDDSQGHLQDNVNNSTIGSGLQNLNIEVKNPQLCPRYIGVLLDNVRIEPSPAWLQKRLKAVGYRPINNIVDATNYVMAELGQPLHAFDAQKIEGGIIVRNAKENEEMITLDDVKRKLTPEMLVIADQTKPVAIAGVMGGANSEVDENTSRVLLEAANFDPISVRKTSVQLNLRTEAVQRFEKSLDPNLAEKAMDRLCEIIITICPGAKILTPQKDIASFSETPQKVTIDLDKISSKIGVDISSDQATKILRSLEFTIIKEENGTLEIEIPSFRATKDVSIEADIAEEIARLYGYENIPPRLPKLPVKLPQENRERQLKHQVRQLLSLGLGFNEVYNYSFYSLKDLQKASLPQELHLSLNNYLSEDQTHLRISLIPNLLKNIEHNLKYYPEFKLYEIGRTYEDLQEYFPLEEKKIVGVIVKNKKFREEVFYEAKGALEALLKFLHIDTEMQKGEALCPYAHPNKYASYHLKNVDKEIGRVFEIHPLVARHYDVDQVKIAAFELNFSLLSKEGKLEAKEQKYKPLPKFPPLEFDVSVIIDRNVLLGEIEKLIHSTSDLVETIELFDLYQGPNIPQDKKAIAYKIVLRAADRTLTDEEMKKVQKDIFDRLIQNGGEIRGLKA